MMAKWYSGTWWAWSFVLQVRENSEKTHPAIFFSDRGSNPSPLRDRSACYRLLHDGGPSFPLQCKILQNNFPNVLVRDFISIFCKIWQKLMWTQNSIVLNWHIKFSHKRVAIKSYFKTSVYFLRPHLYYKINSYICTVGIGIEFLFSLVSVFSQKNKT